MSLFKIEGPIVDPVTLDEVKQYLRVDYNNEDDLIRALIASATAYVELKTRNALITQTWRLVRRAWPRDGRMVVALGPLQIVSAARLVDIDGVAREIAVDSFYVHHGVTPGVIEVRRSEVPQPEPYDRIEIDLICGWGNYGSLVPAPLRQAIRTMVAATFEKRGALVSMIEPLLTPYVGLTL